MVNAIRTNSGNKATSGGVGQTAGGTVAPPGITILGIRLSWAMVFGTLPIYVGLVAIWIYFDLATGNEFFSARNISNMIQGYSYKPVLALGMVLVLLLGEIDLSVGYLTSLGAAICAAFSYVNGWPAAPSILLTILICTACGAAQGALVAWVRMPSFVVTLGGFLIFEGASNHITGATAINVLDPFIQSLGTYFIPGSVGLIGAVAVSALYVGYRSMVRAAQMRAGVPANSLLAFGLTLVLPIGLAIFAVWKLNQYRGVPLEFALLCAFVAIFWFMTTRMPYGRHLYAVGGNLEAARRAGINTTFIRWSCFAISGCMCGVAGVLLLGFQPTASTTLVSPDLLMDVISIAVIGGVSLTGGKGSVWSVLLGFLVVASVDNGLILQATDPYLISSVKGIILVIAVLLDVVGKRMGTMSSRS